MSETSKPTDVPLIKCEICLKEVPKSECKCAEAKDYVLYFCGLDCYEQWQEGEEKKEKE